MLPNIKAFRQLVSFFSVQTSLLLHPVTRVCTWKISDKSRFKSIEHNLRKNQIINHLADQFAFIVQSLNPCIMTQVQHPNHLSTVQYADNQQYLFFHRH